MAAVDPVRAGVVPLVPLLAAPALVRVPLAATGKAGAVLLLYPVGAGALVEALELAWAVAAAAGVVAGVVAAAAGTVGAAAGVVGATAGTVYHC